MWDIRFWILFITVLVVSGVIIAFRKIRFIDLQLIIMVAALSMSCDMIFCKQFGLYTYINTEYRGWYSFWTNLFIFPAWGFIYIKFVPKTIKGISIYIVGWTVASTLFELLVAKPLGIVQYNGWNIIPYSTIGYFLLLIWIYVYYRILKYYTLSK